MLNRFPFPPLFFSTDLSSWFFSLTLPQAPVIYAVIPIDDCFTSPDTLPAHLLLGFIALSPDVSESEVFSALSRCCLGYLLQYEEGFSGMIE